MNHNSNVQLTYKAQRPRSDESMQICHAIDRWQNQTYIAKGFDISNQAVGKWFDRRCQDIFKRMRDFIRGLVDDGRVDLALRILRYLCAGIGYRPVKNPPKLIQFLSLFRSYCQQQTEAAELSAMFFETVNDGVLTLEEIDALLKEIDEGEQSLVNLKSAVKFYREECTRTGAPVAVKFEEFTNRMGNSNSQ